METVREVVQIVVEECPKLLTAIKQAISDSDAAALQREAHTLKGSVEVISATKVTELAKTLELDASQQEFANAAALHSQLETAVDELTGEITRWLQS